MKLAVNALGGLFRLPQPVLRKLAGPPRVLDGQEMDLQTQLALRLALLVDGKPIEQRGLRGARKTFENSTVFDPESPPLAGVENVTMGGAAKGIPARIYRPNRSSRGALVYYHGGGFAIGSLNTVDAVCRELCATSRAVVVSVDYRLAPEHPFPAAVEDGVGAFDWVRDEHAMLDVDPQRVGVGGDSAGGNLAAVVAQQRRDTVRYQLLIYPAVDLAHGTASRDLFAKHLLLTGETVRWFRDMYLPNADDRKDVRASPLLADDLDGVAPACVFVAGIDPLRDEGRAYAERLDEVGALDRLIDDPSMIHGCLSMLTFSARAREIVTELGEALQRGLEATTR